MGRAKPSGNTPVSAPRRALVVRDRGRGEEDARGVERSSGLGPWRTPGGVADGEVISTASSGIVPALFSCQNDTKSSGCVTIVACDDFAASRSASNAACGLNERPGEACITRFGGIGKAGEDWRMCMVFAGQDPVAYESETRSVRLHGHATSIRLERAFWHAIDAIAAAEGVSTTRFLATLYDEVMALHGEVRNFSSLLRCACLDQVRRNAASGA